MLVDDGKVDLDEPVTRWFPGMPNAAKMPVRILLNHQSGLPDFETSMPMISDKVWTAEEIVARVLAVMANEGASILDDGVAAQASDIDLVLLNGYGFPAYRGGPMFAGDVMGWDEVVHQVESMSAIGAPSFKVAVLAKRLATNKAYIHRPG